MVKENDCLRHLRRTNPRHDKARIEETKGGLLEDVYRWILDHDDYKEWLHDPENRLLWVKGDPGKGKTMLLCGVINELKKSTLSDLNQVPVSYFLCQANDNRLNNATNVLLGLMYLLVDQQPSLLSHFEKEYSSAGKELFEGVNAWFALSEIFMSILHDPQLPRATLLIDALDECETDLPKLLRLIETSSSRIPLSIELNADLISHAVRVYIRHKVRCLAKRKRYNNSLRDFVETYLVAKANDTFLWVALVCEQLEGPKVTKRSTRQVLESFPPGLDSLYERMLKQIDDTKDAKWCKRILAITAVAFQPLTLKEVRALDETLQDDLDDDGMKEVAANCGSFLAVRNHLIYFVHQSATDFILNKTSHEVMSGSIENEHLSIFSRSLQNLSQVLRRDIYDLNNPGIFVNQITKPNPDPLTAKYLYWLEALGLLAGVSKGITSLARLGDLPQKGTKLWDLIHDANRFIRYFRQAIETSPLQVYASALAFAPARSIVWNIFHKEMYNWICSKPQVRPDWGACLQTFGVSGFVRSVAFSPDSKFLASGSDDSKVRIWSAAAGALEQTLQHDEHDGSVESVAFSSDSKLLASGSSARSDVSTIRIWSAATGVLQQHLSHGGHINSVAFSPNSKLVASCSSDCKVRIWSVATGVLQYTLQSNGVNGWVAFSSDSMLLTTASYQYIRVWSVATGELQRTTEMQDHDHYIFSRSMAFSPDLKLLALGWFQHIQIRSAITGVSQQTFQIRAGAESLAFSSDSTFLAAGAHGNIWIWSIATGTLQYAFEAHDDHYNHLNAIAFSPDSNLLASGSDNIQIWSIITSTLQQNAESTGYGGSITSVALSPDLKLLASSSGNNIRIHSVATGAVQQTFQSNGGYIVSLAFSPDCKLLASIATGALQQTLFQSSGAYTASLTFSPDCKLLASSNAQDEIQIHSSNGAYTASLAFSPDSKLLASRSATDIVYIWSTVTNGLQQTLQDDRVQSMAYSPDSTLLGIQSYDSTVRIRSTATGELQDTVEGDNNIVSSLFTFNNEISSEYGFNRDRDWITCSGRYLLWLPVDFRPYCFTISGSTIALGYLSGMVVILRFDTGSIVLS
ncbi:beta transducin-like protein HET-D2Y [Xylaria acuta]|nr:beta transducin-like protein HET-D2Y [Xylaria acuta]